MSDFDAQWLAGRRDIDHASRAPIPAGFHEYLDSRGQPLRAMDLGAGTGSNVSFLDTALARKPNWTLVENDPKLIASAQLPAEIQSDVKWLNCDLATSLPEALKVPNTLITGSALLDLVSADWLSDLVSIGVGQKAAFLFALTYDGIHGFNPPDEGDGLITSLFNRHQQTDKGFGPALGPHATARLRELLADAGYRVETAQSNWTIGPDRADFADTLLFGIAQAAMEVAPAHQVQIDQWTEKKRNKMADGTLVLMVGHQDLFAWPA